jgi:UDP-N-acetylglucosamine 2-epimerase (non-hydrolysing)
MTGILSALREIVEQRSDVEIIFPAHPNPSVRAAAAEAFGQHPRVKVIEPLDYPAFVRAMADAYLIVTDSGGVQEEAPFLRKPVIVIRNETERPEALAYGVARLVGTDPLLLRAAIDELFDNPEAYAAMTTGASPYGDGHAAERILALVGNRLGEVPKVRIPAMFTAAALCPASIAYA